MRIKKGDHYIAEFVLYWDDGSEIDLTNADEIKFMMKLDSTDAEVISGTCSLADAENGKVHYEFTAEDTATAGMYKYEFQITWALGYTFTVPSSEQLWLFIVSDLGD